jgi:hypothetical protein
MTLAVIARVPPTVARAMFAANDTSMVIELPPLPPSPFGPVGLSSEQLPIKVVTKEPNATASIPTRVFFRKILLEHPAFVYPSSLFLLIGVLLF